MFGGQQVGKVQVIPSGLYLAFHCRCQLTGSVVCRLWAVYENHRESLGVLVPMGEGFGLDTKLPKKRFPEGKPTFLVLPKHEAANFAPISPEEPFAYIQRLKDGFLDRQDGQLGLSWKEDSSSPTGQ